ncbi:MAG: hypothetical protein RJA83_206 [Pseudomonadota bacterium]|jgi:hypothetical protein
MKKSETTAYLIAGVLATSVLLTGCGGGSGGGMSGLGATGAAGTAGTPGAGGSNLLDVLGSTGGVVLDLQALGSEGIQISGLTPTEVGRLEAGGFTGGLDVQVLRSSDGALLAINTPAGAFAFPGITLPAVFGTGLPTIPTNIANLISGVGL